VDVDELLNSVVVVAEWQHFVDQKHQAEVAGWLL
jgi:hypothetical protein